MSPNQRFVKECCPALLEDGSLQHYPIPTPREAMRRMNCQDYRFQRAEAYPSIRAQVSRCDHSQAQAMAWLSNSLEAAGCGRPFDPRKDNEWLLWQQDPRKEALGFYGVGSPSLQPESVVFNQTLMASLNKAGVDGTSRRSKRPTPPTPPQKTPISGNPVHNLMCQPLILNRQALQAELQQMPIVRQRLHPSTAFETAFCSDDGDPDDPLGVAQHTEMMISMGQALGTDRPPKKTPHGLRRRHWYCPSDCGGEQNACTQYEWAKYKLDPRPYNKEFGEWLSGQEAIEIPEPKDYEQLYERFQKCFEQQPSPDPLCKMYEICCGTKDSHGDDGQGGGDGHGGAGGAGGEGQENDEGTTGGTDGTEHEDKDGNTNKTKEKDNDKKKDNIKDKDGDKDKFKDKNKDNDKDKDMNKDKTKDDITDKNKNKDMDTGKKTGVGKDKIGKKRGSGDRDEDSTRGTKRKSQESRESKDKHINIKDPNRDKPTKIQDLQNNDDLKIPSWLEGRDSDQEAPINQLESDDDDVEPGDDAKFKRKDKPQPRPESAKKKKRKDKGKAKDKSKAGKQCPPCPPVGCPCEICGFLKNCRGVKDPPFIKDMMRAEKKRQLLAYARQMRHREYIRTCGQQDLQKPNFEKHRDCLDAVQDLEKLLAGCQDQGFDPKVLQLVENLRRRICQRMSDCIPPSLNCSGAQCGF